ncbi:hypothetical protein CB1_001984026 [Camelus ferus]|nr:hypothetical protein CB1_001984026 [Camelus ferus]
MNTLCGVNTMLCSEAILSPVAVNDTGGLHSREVDSVSHYFPQEEPKFLGYRLFMNSLWELVGPKMKDALASVTVQCFHRTRAVGAAAERTQFREQQEGTSCVWQGSGRGGAQRSCVSPGKQHQESRTCWRAPRGRLNLCQR